MKHIKFLNKKRKSLPVEAYWSGLDRYPGGEADRTAGHGMTFATAITAGASATVLG